METYSPMMDATIFRYLICLIVLKRLDLCVMDVVTAYLHESLDNDIHIWKSLKDFKCLKQLIQNIVAYTQLSYKDPCIRLSNPNTCGTITSMNIWSEKYVCLPYLSMHIHYVEYFQLL